jgi:hypothetical protein
MIQLMIITTLFFLTTILMVAYHLIERMKWYSYINQLETMLSTKGYSKEVKKGALNGRK